jgi:DNA-directed RNA polymerase subunit RPC12/RpoP
MALVTLVDCTKCGKAKHEVTDHSGICMECRQKIASKARRRHLASLRGLTMKERIELIEAELYDLDGSKRLNGLEARTATY